MEVGSVEYCGKMCMSCTVQVKSAFQKTFTVGLILVLSTLLGAASAQDNIIIDTDSYINSIGTQNKPQQWAETTKIPVSLMWGIGDASATIGRLFNHAIPADAFKGEILSISVRICDNLIIFLSKLIQLFFTLC